MWAGFGGSLLTNRISDGHKSILVFLFLSCAGSLALGVGGVGCHIVRILKQLYGEVPMDRNQDLQPTTSANLPTFCMSPVESKSSSSDQAFRWLQPWLTSWLQLHETSLAKTSKVATPKFLTHSNCEIINICCFKSVNLVVICYTARGMLQLTIY